MKLGEGERKFLTVFVVFLTIYHVIARFGLAVDLQWHTDVGRDQLFTPPHLMIFGGIIPTMLFLITYIFWNSFYKQENYFGMKFGPFIAPIPIWMIFSGMMTLFLGGLYDDYWHVSYGVDTTIITPPHIWTFVGGMIVETATIILAIYLKNHTEKSSHKLLNLSILVSMWALVYHLHIAFANFLDPRVWSLDIVGLEIILHFFFAGASLLILIPLQNSILGEKGVISLCTLLLSSQLLFLVIVPELVSVMMTEEHAYRPGSPNIVWAANCLPWLLLPGALIVRKYSSFNNPSAMIALVIIVDAAWLPTFIEHIPSEVGLFNTMISIVFSVFALRLIWSLNSGISKSINRLSSDIEYKSGKGGIIKTNLVVSFVILLLLPTASGHAIHFSEDGEGFDAPKRFIIDIDDNYVWVEFMIWPPKATSETELIIYVHENETTIIDDIWVELVYPGEKGDVTMITYLDNPGDYQLWHGSVKFPFAGNQSLEIWAEVNGTESYTEIPINVDSPAVLPVWLAWTIGLAWPIILIFYWHKVSLRSKVIG